MHQFHKSGSLPFWNEYDIMLREQCIERLSFRLKKVLSKMNKAWEFKRVEAPILTPLDMLSKEYYDSGDAFVTDNRLFLRAETTPGSYICASHFLKTGKKLPLCVWQSGKSFRIEKNDGASATKLRFNEFYQLEFQCLYSENTMADYRGAVIEALADEAAALTGFEVLTIPSDRLPAYSESTLDLMVTGETSDDGFISDRWGRADKVKRETEICSISIRNDYAESIKVLEVAFGLDRMVYLMGDESYEDLKR